MINKEPKSNPSKYFWVDFPEKREEIGGKPPMPRSLPDGSCLFLFKFNCLYLIFIIGLYFAWLQGGIVCLIALSERWGGVNLLYEKKQHVNQTEQGE